MLITVKIRPVKTPDSWGSVSEAHGFGRKRLSKVLTRKVNQLALPVRVAPR